MKTVSCLCHVVMKTVPWCSGIGLYRKQIEVFAARIEFLLPSPGPRACKMYVGAFKLEPIW